MLHESEYMYIFIDFHESIYVIASHIVMLFQLKCALLFAINYLTKSILTQKL